MSDSHKDNLPDPARAVDGQTGGPAEEQADELAALEAAVQQEVGQQGALEGEAEQQERPRPQAAPDGSEAARGRRDFFGDALREMITPLAGVLERRVNPMLEALTALPDEVDRLAGQLPGALDQPHVTPPPPSAPIRMGVPGVAGTSPARNTAMAGVVFPERYLRPPGALPPGEFETVCSRCGKCVEACPAVAIKLDKSGLIAEGAPYIVPADMPCVVCDSLACMRICPSGALKLVDKLAIDMGTAKVDQGLCRRSSGEDCRICVEACPVGETALVIGASGKVRVKRDGCIGCGVCEQACPTEPRAIIVQPFEIKPEPIVA